MELSAKLLMAFIDISKVWSKIETVKYPSFSGMLKEDAQNGRKKYLQDWVRGYYDTDLDGIVLFNPKISELLDHKVPMALADEKATQACKNLLKQRQKFALDGDFHYWQSGECENDIGTLRANDTDTQRALVQDRSARAKRTRLLISTVLELDAKRTNDTEVSINIKIDWPKFFMNYKFQNLSELVEK